MSKINFRCRCPFCDDNSLINWSHEGCSSSKGMDIDIEGYVTCNDCGKRMDLLDMNFYCKTLNEKKSFTSISQLRKFFVVDIDNDSLDTLIENLFIRWNKTH